MVDRSKLRKGPTQTHRRGEGHPAAKLCNDDVLEIVTAAEDGYTISSIARAFDITATNVRAIIQGKTWSWLTGIERAVGDQDGKA